MDVSYAPRGQVAAWLRRGWRLSKLAIYRRDDPLVVMVLDDAGPELSDEQIDKFAAYFQAPAAVPVPGSSNTERGAWIARNATPRVRRECAIPGCCRVVEARGWCQTHYSRWQRHGNPMTVLKPNCGHGRSHEWRRDTIADWEGA